MKDPEQQRHPGPGSDASYVDYMREAIAESARFRAEYDGRRNVIKAADMPFERSPDGLVQHIVHEKMNTKECCIELYMQFLDPGRRTGKQRHLSEEIAFVVEGSGYDLHWDVRFDCADEFIWEWETEPKRYAWKAGDYVYVPPYCIHQRCNGDDANPARVIVCNNKIIRDMGFDWFEQIENAEGF